jgi:hypothetical protein
VTLVTKTVDGIINLSSLDIKSIIATMKLPTIQDNSLLAKLSGVSFAILIIFLLVLVIYVMRKFNLSEKMNKFVNKIIKYIFWNFLIRYSQVSFINFSYASLTSVLTTESLSEKIISAIILTLLYLLVCLIAYILYMKPYSYLCLETTK